MPPTTNDIASAISAYQTYRSEIEKYQNLDIVQVCEFFRQYTKAPTETPVTLENINNPELKDENAVLILEFETPEWNDGNPCEFRLSDLCAVTFGELQPFIEEMSDLSPIKTEAEIRETIKDQIYDVLSGSLPCGDSSREVISQVRKVIVENERVFEDLFGTNVKLIIYANDFDTVYNRG